MSRMFRRERQGRQAPPQLLHSEPRDLVSKAGRPGRPGRPCRAWTCQTRDPPHIWYYCVG
eukprot:scaffold15888_cov48-Phaeocystis_antarctica.AAC.2